VSLDLFSRGSFIVITIFIARALGVKEFGKFGYAISLAQIFYIFTDLGMHLNLLKELGEQRGKNEALWKTYLDLKLFVMGITLLFFVFLSSTLWKWESPWIAVAVLFWMFGNSMLDFNQTVCNGLSRMDVARIQMLIHRTILILFAVFGILFSPNLKGIVLSVSIGSVLGALVSTVYFCSVTGVGFSFSLKWTQWKRIISASLPNAFSGAFGLWYLRLGPLFLAWIWTTREVGEFSAAFRIFETSYILPAAIMAISVPHLSQAFQKGARIIKKELFRVAGIILPLGLLWGGGIFFFSSLIINLLFGAEFSAAIGVLKILSIASGLVFINYFVTHLMIVLNRQKRHALHQGLIFLVSCVLYAVLIPKGGAIGAAWALLWTEGVLFTVTVSYLLIRYTLVRKI